MKSTSLSEKYLRIAVAVLLGAATLSAAVKCPSYQGKNPLNAFSVFDGPPEQLGDLVPDVIKGDDDHLYSRWDIAYLFKNGRGVYVVCRYAGGDPKGVAIQLKEKAEHCVFQGRGKGAPAEASCK